MKRTAVWNEQPLQQRGRTPSGLDGVLWLTTAQETRYGVRLRPDAPPRGLEQRTPAPEPRGPDGAADGLLARVRTLRHEVQTRRSAAGEVEIGVRSDGGPTVWHQVQSGLGLVNAFDDASGALALDVAHRTARARDQLRVLRWGHSAELGLVAGRPLVDGPLRYACAAPQELGRAPTQLFALEVVPNGEAGLVRIDLRDGRTTRHAPAFGQRFGPPTAIATAASRRAAADTWLVCCVRDLLRDLVELWVLRATDLQQPPVAALRLPSSVRYEVHARWVDTDANSDERI